MHLRLTLLAIRLFDPRLWRTRLKQLGVLTGIVTWVWVRAVQRAEVDRAVADVRHAQRVAAIRTRNHERELAQRRPPRQRAGAAASRRDR